MYCEVNMDECESVRCMYNASCEDNINDFYCHCPPGEFAVM